MTQLRNLVDNVGSARRDVRVEEIAEPPIREIRYVDMLIDELAQGSATEKIPRIPPTPHCIRNCRLE